MLVGLILILHLILVIIGLFLHALFLKYVVFKLTSYFRISVLMISLGMILFLLSYLAMQLYCIHYGTILNDSNCPESAFKEILKGIHLYGTMSHLTGHLIFSIDRLINITFVRLHNSDVYLILFILFIVLNEFFIFVFVFSSGDQALFIFWIIVINGIIFSILPIELLINYLSKWRYKSTIGENLNRRLDISNSYEMSRCFIFSAIMSIFLQILLMIHLWLGVLGTVNVETTLWIFIGDLIFDVEFIIFPLIVLLMHRDCRRRLNKDFRKIFGLQTAYVNVMTNLQGNPLIQIPSQAEYFDQLTEVWHNKKHVNG